MRFIVCLIALLLSPPAFAQSPVTTSQTYVNATIKSNGIGAITGTNLNAAFNTFYPIFNSLGTWSSSGVYTPNPIPVAQLPVIPPSLGGCGVASLSGLLKGNGTSPCTAAAPGTDYLLPNGSGAGLTGITSSSLDPQAATTVQVTPAFCPYSQIMSGTIPNDTCVQNAINYACATISSAGGSVGGVLMFARGNYYIQHGVNIPAACAGLYLRGQGEAATRITTDQNCTQVPIYFYPDATANYVANGGGVSDLQLFNNNIVAGTFTGSTSCLKPIIQVNFGRLVKNRNISAISPYQLVKFVGGYNLTNENIQVDVALPGSPGIFEYTGYGNSTSSTARQDLIFHKNISVFTGVPATGQKRATVIWWHGLSGNLTTDHTYAENAPTGLKIDCTEPGVASGLQATDISNCPGFGVFNDFEIEAGGGANVVDITDAQYMKFNGLYGVCFARTDGSTPDTAGCNNVLRVYNTTFHTTGKISLVGGNMNGAQLPCVSYEGDQLNISGASIYGCDATHSFSAEIILNSPPTGNASGGHVISTSVFCRGPNSTSVGINTDGLTAVYIGGGDYLGFFNNQLFGCAGATFGSAGTHSVVTPNIGP